MASEWPRQPLSELTERGSSITYGVVKPGDEGPVRFVRGGDIAGGRVLTDQLRTITDAVSTQYRRTLLRGGELLVSLVGNPGQVAIAPGSLAGANIARQVGLIRLGTGVVSEFVKYFLLSPEGQRSLRAHSIGSVQQVINLQDLKTVRIPVPPLPVQQRIADVLGTLDDKIELNRRMNRTLEKMAAAIFKSWFIDFDPVHAKAEARDPGLPAEIADLFPDTFEDSAVGPIPTGWTVAPMKDLADVNARSIKKDYPHARIRYVDISSVSQGSLDQTTTYVLAEAPSRAKRLVQTGDTIWSCVRPNRKAYLYIDRPADNLVVSTGFAVLSPRAVPASYLHQWVTTQAFVDYLTAYATGAAYPAVKADTFETAKMILPGKGILKAFHDLAGPLRARIAHNQRQNLRMSGLRDTLLPKLLSGEIEVPGAEVVAEEVAP